MGGVSSYTKSMSSQVAEEARTLDIPEELFHPTSDVIHLYALTSVSIGMASYAVEEWEKRAILKEKVRWDKTGTTIKVVISEKIRKFYNMDVSKLDITGVPEKDLVMIIVDFAS